MKKFLVIIAMLLLPLNALALVEISDGSVKALYHLENVTDSSGNGYNLTNNSSTAFVAGKLTNGAYVISANSQYLTIANALGINGVISYSTWFKPDAGISATQNLVTLSNGDGADQADYYLRYTSSGTPKIEGLRIRMGIGTSVNINYNTTLSTSTYSHLAMTYTNAGAGDARLYLNGTEVASGTGTGAGNFNDGVGTGIGTLGRLLGNNPATGILDEVVITNNVLSATTISALYNGGVGSEVCVTAGCGSVRKIRGVGITR